MSVPKKSGRGSAPGSRLGSPNKRTAELNELLQAHVETKHGIKDYDPIIALVDIALDANTPLGMKVECHARIIPYIHAQRKQIDVTGSISIEAKMQKVDQIMQKLTGDIIDVATEDDLDGGH